MRFAHAAGLVVNGVRSLDLAVGSASSISRLVKRLAMHVSCKTIEDRCCQVTKSK